ncbi:MAG TPA: O-methyltransferase [Candidatus Dormibacteraeota bacterium]|nr:O-methyltransferase [Candidatus Dormibacteraeota bacterium]
MKRVESTDELQAYMESLLPPRDPVLARLEDEAHREHIPIVDPHEGMLLYLLVRLSGAKRLLELGTATGYSGIWMLRATNGGTLTTFEMDHPRAQRARANFAEAGFADQALVLEENAVQGLEKLDAKFDACFIDLINSFRSEDITRRVLELCLERLDPGALLLTDNALQQGEVVRPSAQNTRNAAYYNELVSKHPRLESVAIPIRDGLSVARVKDP